MEKKFTDFSMEEGLRLANSDAGKQLLQLLQTQHADIADAAGRSAGAGDLAQAGKTLSALMTDPQASALLRLLWEEYYGRNGK